MLGELRDQLGRGLGKRAPGIMLEMPAARDHGVEKRIKRPIVADRALCKNLRVEVTRVPVVQHHADIEDDGSWAHTPD